jgi:hypothetical protein
MGIHLLLQTHDELTAASIVNASSVKKTAIKNDANERAPNEEVSSSSGM